MSDDVKPITMVEALRLKDERIRELEAQLTPPEPVQAGEYRVKIRKLQDPCVVDGHGDTICRCHNEIMARRIAAAMNTPQRCPTCRCTKEEMQAVLDGMARRMAAAMNGETWDETPIDEAWLKSIGFYGGWERQEHLDLAGILRFQDEGESKRWEWWLESNCLRILTTRGQLRLLMKALGISLPPSAHAAEGG